MPNRDRIMHEAEIVAVIFQVVQQEGFEFWDDELYLEYCQAIQRAALDVVEASRQRDYEAARTATGQMQKSCSSCHEDFRA